MTDAPERIWIEDERSIGGTCHVHNEPTDCVLKYAIEYVRADLSVAVTVKPLEWREQSDREYWYSADGFGVKYEVKEIGLSEWWLSIDGEMQTVPFDYCRDAKAAAQTDYERRTLSTINVTPAPEQPSVQEDNEALIDEIEEIISETHDIDVTDRNYAENIVGWLRLHHPAALRALKGGGE
jgi:hypothetical protein